jgi:hypothetical protein
LLLATGVALAQVFAIASRIPSIIHCLGSCFVVFGFFGILFCAVILFLPRHEAPDFNPLHLALCFSVPSVWFLNGCVLCSWSKRLEVDHAHHT